MTDLTTALAETVRHAERLRRLLEPTREIQRLHRQFAEIERRQRELANAFRVNDHLTASFRQAVEALDQAGSPARAAASEIAARSLELNRIVSGFDQLQVPMLEAARYWDSLPTFRNVRTAPIVETMLASLQAHSADESDVSLEGVVEDLAEAASEATQVNESPLSGDQTSLIVQMVFALYLFLLSYAQSAESTSELRTEIYRLGDSLGAAVAALATSPEETTLWLPTHRLSRGLHLRMGPGTETSSLRTLPTNSLVEVLDDEGAWLRVRVFDFDTASYEFGWVYGGYVKVLSPVTPFLPQRN